MTAHIHSWTDGYLALRERVVQTRGLVELDTGARWPRTTGGDVIAIAALMPLPGAPVATAEVSTDVGNLILYQGSLASYAKRDEQVRTLGNLVTKLLG